MRDANVILNSHRNNMVNNNPFANATTEKEKKAVVDLLNSSLLLLKQSLTSLIHPMMKMILKIILEKQHPSPSLKIQLATRKYLMLGWIDPARRPSRSFFIQKSKTRKKDWRRYFIVVDSWTFEYAFVPIYINSASASSKIWCENYVETHG